MEFRTRLPLLTLLLCSFITFSKSQVDNKDSSCTTPKNDVGICIDIYQCQPIMNALNSAAITDQFKLELKKYFCGFNNNNSPKVCCPNKDIIPQPQSDDGNSILPMEDCGESEALDRITNGDKADLLEFPWQVALKYVSKKNIPYSCGGSLIHKRYVLTAAHCINSKLIGVRLGEYDFSTSTDCVTIRNITTCAPPHQDFDITFNDAIVHPEYNKIPFIHDIALIRLPRDAIFNNAVKPICLPINEVLTPKSLKNLLVTGWGRTESSSQSLVLLKAAVPLQEHDICRKRYSPTQIQDTQFCAGGKDGKDSCKGDSGGPIMTAINVDGVIKTVQVGLVSVGPNECGLKDFAAIYTKLSSYSKWILDNINP